MSSLYALLSLLALPIASFWYWPLQRESAVQLHALWLSGNRIAWIMMVMQTLLAVSYLGLTQGILSAVREPAKALLKESGGERYGEATNMLT